MDFIEILQKIKSWMKGFLQNYTMKDLWDEAVKYSVTPEMFFKYFIEQNVGIEEIVPFFYVMGLNLNEILELFIGLNVYYNEHDFIRELEKKYSKEEIIEAYRNSSLDESKINRILLDYYDVDGLPKEIKESMVRKSRKTKKNLSWVIP